MRACTHVFVFVFPGGEAVSSILARRKYLQTEESDSEDSDDDW